MTKDYVFEPEEFKLVDTSPEFHFEPEVASSIANAVYQNDGGDRNHRHASSFIGEGFEIRVSDVEQTAYSGKSTQQITPRITIPTRAFRSEVLSNISFGREFQRALDQREYANRMSVAGTLGFMATIYSIPTGFILAALGQEGLTMQEAALAAGGGTAIGTLAVTRHRLIKNIYRKIITNPKNYSIHNAHLDRAAILAGRLGLDPVLTRS